MKKMSRFSETFDVPTLCKEIIERIKTPAETGKMYKVECVNVKKSNLSNIEIEFRTTENKYINMKFNLDNSLNRCINFLSTLGTDYQNVENVKGNKYEIFYQDSWNMFIIKKLH